MERTFPRSQRAAERSTTALRAAIERHGLLVYTLIAFGITWSILIVAFAGISAGVIDPEGAFVAVGSQLAPAGPLIAAIVVVAASRGRAGLAALARSLVRWRVNPLWYAYVFVATPALVVAGVTLLRGSAVVGTLLDNWQILVAQWPLMVLSVAVFTGLAEEPGWRGYALPWTNRRFQPLVAALIVSIIWSLWHVPNALFTGIGIETGLHVVSTVVNGLVFAWMVNSTGSVFLAVLAHGVNNSLATVFMRALADTPAGVSEAQYYVLSAVTFGVVIAVVAYVTRGRLGLPNSQPST